MIKSQQSFDRIRQKYLLYVNQYMIKYFINNFINLINLSGFVEVMAHFNLLSIIIV